MSRLTILVPTYNKNQLEIKKLVSDLNIQGNVIFSNQIDNDSIINDDKLTIINNKTKGVSVNRNILLDSVKTEYFLFIDDDCKLIDNYESIVVSEFDRHRDAEVIVFSRDSEDTMFAPVMLKDKKAKRFCHVSKMGGPGIAIKTTAIKKYNISFNEKLGTPNYFYNGEDSYFLYELIKKKVVVYTSSTQIYKLLSSKDKSSYFTSYDNHFFEAVGGIQYLLHKHLFYLYFIKQGIFYHFKAKVNFLKVFKYFCIGKKKMRHYL